MDQDRVCNSCGGALNEDSKFCPACGTNVEIPSDVGCPSCGEKNALDAKHCDKCGSLMSEPEEPLQPEPLEVSQNEPDFMGSEILCTNCGAKLVSESKFCTSCGKELPLPESIDEDAGANTTEESVSSNTETEEKTEEDLQQEKESRKKNVKGGCSLLVVIGLIVGIALAYCNSGSEDWGESLTVGQDLYDAGKYSQAIDEFVKITDGASEEIYLAQAYYWIGRSNQATGANAPAVASFTKALDVHTTASPASLYDYYLQRGKTREDWGASTFAVDPEGGKELLIGAFDDFELAISQAATGEAYLALSTCWTIAGQLDPSYFSESEAKANLALQKAKELSPSLFIQ